MTTDIDRSIVAASQIIIEEGSAMEDLVSFCAHSNLHVAIEAEDVTYYCSIV